MNTAPNAFERRDLWRTPDGLGTCLSGGGEPAAGGH
jgi:hypothetical protein